MFKLDEVDGITAFEITFIDESMYIHHSIETVGAMIFQSSYGPLEFEMSFRFEDEIV